VKRLLAALLASLAAQAAAQDWPRRPVHLVVGVGAGGGTDILGRIIAPALGEALGQPVLVENRPGAAGTIAAGSVARAAPDGYSALLMDSGHTVSAAMLAPLAYDPVADFQPVSLVASMPLVVLAGPRAGFGSFHGLVEVAQHNPGKLYAASIDAGSTPHFAAALLFETAGIRLVHVPFKSTPNAIAATVSNDTQVLVETAAAVIGHVRVGALNALAVTSGARLPGLPQVPTVAESGLPGYDMSTWYALAFPAQTPDAIVEKVRTALARTLAREDVSKRMRNAAFAPEVSTPAELRAHLESEIARWSALRGRADIRK
jgi:tripartite-type tricarboxylate transporter receptor subunit TctC